MIRSFFGACHGAIVALTTGEGRKAWAMALLGGCMMAMTVYASAALVFVKHRPPFVFYLGLSAHLIILVVGTAIAAMLVKRSIVLQLGKDRRLEFSDQGDAATSAAATAAVAAAEAAAPSPPSPPAPEGQP